jgi:light-harvesting protein B-800-850 alpha chain
MDTNLNLAKIWLVVKPTVGIPFFFASVAITALIVHAAVLNHTTWYPAYLNGHARTTISSATTTNAVATR